MRVGETGVGEMGVGETGIPRIGISIGIGKSMHYQCIGISLMHCPSLIQRDKSTYIIGFICMIKVSFCSLVISIVAVKAPMSWCVLLCKHTQMPLKNNLIVLPTYQQVLGVYLMILWQNIHLTLNLSIIIISHFVTFLNIGSGNIVSFYENYTGTQGQLALAR